MSIYLMMAPALVIGFLYGYVSSRGQFCMNSGFSNVIRKKDTTKLKSFVAAILIQMAVLPLVFTLLYLSDATQEFVKYISLPPLFLISTAVGGFLFGIFMYYSAGCGAGIFYKMGEKNTGAILAAIGFTTGIYLTGLDLFQGLINHSANTIVYDQQPIWKGDSPLIFAGIVSLVAALFLFLLFKKDDQKPGGASWGWKKTGIAVGIIGSFGWMLALYASTPYGMSIIPGVMDIVDLHYSWPILFLIGIPVGAFWNTRKNKEKKFTIPNSTIVVKRLLGGLGLGISGGIAAGCTVGHGLTFTSVLGIGSFIGIIFIFLGSGLVGYLTRK